MTNTQSPPAVWTATIDAVPAEPSLRNTALAGALAVLAGFGGFLVWGFTASLDSAALAAGTVMVESHRKTVSHLEGGILRDLLVKDGDLVQAGQVLLRMDSTQSRAVVSQLQGQYWTALARLGRLRAEQADAPKPLFAAELLAAVRDNPVAAEAMTVEERLFNSRRDSYEAQLGIQRKQISQLRNEIVALEAQRAATADRLRYTEDELRVVQELLAKGYERKPRLLELQRNVADSRGRLGELMANKSKAEQAIAAAELEMIDIGNTRRSEVGTDLQTAQASVADLSERLRSADDVLLRQGVTAPQAGRVTGLRFFTPGGVIPAGAGILDIVPQDDAMIVEARVSTSDIQNVEIGSHAMVKLTGYRQRTVLPVPGEVVALSADQLVDDRTGVPYFAARIGLDAKVLASMATVELHPGMPAEVMIHGHARRAIDYFLTPLTDGLQKAFREK
ncbi:HlyD family type I secretion periplasmic adaptor subunit [Azospirillum sp. TSO35-2]|uniref:HlyD family type I secretion periplasmic adaptor subunit n=1 Tax=Azospirillum sp. TSO35-2 TaxID=716796 RepID=UPI000D60FB42|nr:HlyD family type I secretion periplasmic adaptor subunit [Azospirillum sp. TSO35-2]PWC32938.1 type I secretion membrane fusion protein [Azospirillum sp. TSO35-2]